MSNIDSSKHRRFAIALSFPGERREYVEQVANALLPAFGGEKDRIFYDDWHEGSIIGYGSNRKLQNIYATDSDLIVPFYCQDYLNKEWCGVELRAIEELLFDREFDRVLPFRFDRVAIPGSFKTDIFPIVSDRPPEDVALLIVDRYRALHPSGIEEEAPRDRRRNAGVHADSPAQPAKARSVPAKASAALVKWRDKLEYLQEQLAVVTSSAQKFELKTQIAEAKEMIKELGG